MAYQFAAASSQYLEIPISGISLVPLTMACWNKRTDSTGHSHFTIGEKTNNHRHNFNIDINGGHGVTSVGPSAQQTTTVPLPTSTGIWIHSCSVHVSASERSAYLNGGNKNTGTVNIGTQNSPTYIAIGARYLNTFGRFYSGDIADCGIWNVVLTDAEIASLAKGMACDKVRPQSLVFYAPLARDLIDVRGGLAITNNNTATVANHTRIYQ